MVNWQRPQRGRVRQGSKGSRGQDAEAGRKEMEGVSQRARGTARQRREHDKTVEVAAGGSTEDPEE